MSRRKKSRNNFLVIFIFILFISFVIYLLYNFDYKEKINNNEVTTSNNVNEKSNKTKEQAKSTNTKKTAEEIKIPKTETKENKNQNSNKNVDVSQIELVGEENVTINVGEEYNDPGAKAYNTNNEDISDQIKVESNLDINSQGEYTITYSIGNYIVMRFITVR